ncbi:MAG: ISAs1 family transposase [Tunicatimonas sp.]
MWTTLSSCPHIHNSIATTAFLEFYYTTNLKAAAACYVCERTDLLEETLAWKNIQSIIMVHAMRETGSKQQEEYRFYLSDQVASPAYFNKRIREHWGIENQLHWHLDVSFDEDRCRTHIKNGAENRNTLRKLSLQLLKQMKDKHSIKVRRKKAGWDDDYLLQIIRQYCSG